jgi:hypothetical protein
MQVLRLAALAQEDKLRGGSLSKSKSKYRSFDSLRSLRMTT